ncbi:hypothetical protein EDC65_0911 [Stella humosa]|uniref:Uncharacterized protein n=1 Tax=Stella humosa TaxID=94 RepID=A0A3N1MEY0_9PROT|nr:hypothetical protein [Stella humosa]ROQ01725.1 hypothetical protein EDC65_0911 [Stella humosa]BBK32107.1 hypothetical protein STHU_27410 [Stella humosa]
MNRPDAARRRFAGAPFVALFLALPLAACLDPATTLNDIGRVRATFYRHELPVANAGVSMPGDRLVPQGQAGGCKPAASAGLFDPCRPDPDQQELDSAGMPKPPLGPWADRTRSNAGQARARKQAAAPVPGRKPTAAVKAPARPPKAGPVKTTPAKAAPVKIKPAKAAPAKVAPVKAATRKPVPAKPAQRPRPVARPR